MNRKLGMALIISNPLKNAQCHFLSSAHIMQTETHPNLKQVIMIRVHEI